MRRVLTLLALSAALCAGAMLPDGFAPAPRSAWAASALSPRHSGLEPPGGPKPLEGLPAAEEQLALYEALEEAAKADEEGPEQEEDDGELVFKDIEALKAHIFTLSDNHMEQVVTLVRGWMRNDETAKA